MLWVKWLVGLEPRPLRQAKYGHCAAQQFCLIFARELCCAAIGGNIFKYLFLKGKSGVPSAQNVALCASGILLCVQRGIETRPLAVGRNSRLLGPWPISTSAACRVSAASRVGSPASRVRFRRIQLKKSEYRLGPRFQRRGCGFQNADAGGLIIPLRLDGARSLGPRQGAGADFAPAPCRGMPCIAEPPKLMRRARAP